MSASSTRCAGDTGEANRGREVCRVDGQRGRDGSGLVLQLAQGLSLRLLVLDGHGRRGRGRGRLRRDVALAGGVGITSELRHDGRCCADDAKHGNSSDRRTDPGAAPA
ncbi:hypothetical protein [Nocardioides sp. B-3]|uniref:hypothetical protein n=1 Tax=Nocardioides sp. B-3 TaxID=2895565 RepID=UPI002153224C|nr:hypothetical protein [Nocardioides sp. B-3]UUZ61342.1 hypothetical protein LP418_12630 [Nocardioides sp. B-3]